MPDDAIHGNGAPFFPEVDPHHITRRRNADGTHLCIGRGVATTAQSRKTKQEHMTKGSKSVHSPSRTFLIYAALLILAILAVYLPGLQNELVFDDVALKDGSLLPSYGSLFQLWPRTVSYGSFVWVDSLFGEGWWKQRIVNLLLHIGVVAALYAFLRSLFGASERAEGLVPSADFEASRTAALRVSVALFALNPVAVYGVAYLIQRSILMATLFSVLACWMFVRGLCSGRVAWFIAAFASYVVALFSKEYAIMTIFMAIPLYIHIRQPGTRRVALVALAVFLLSVPIVLFLWKFYGSRIGEIFDEHSIYLAQQIDSLNPGALANIFPLSVLNEAGRFLAYGFLWVFPNIGWMSIDLRPAFPLDFNAPFLLLGSAAYLVLLGASIWFVLRRRDLWGLVGVLLFFPLISYIISFYAVWIQEPFVLYRSYLWAIAIPGLAALVLMHFTPRVIYSLGLVLSLVFGGLALERITVMKNSGTVWQDAVEKFDLAGPANMVGRGRAFLNLGTYQIERGRLDEGLGNLKKAAVLGDFKGSANMSIGIVLQLQKKHSEALQAFFAAEAHGFRGVTLDYHRGVSAFALGKYTMAFDSFKAALAQQAETKEGGDRLRWELEFRHAESALLADKSDTAVAGFEKLVQYRPKEIRFRMGLAAALESKGEVSQAVAIFDNLLSESRNPAILYNRALAYNKLGKQAESLQDIEEAIKLDPNNQIYRQTRQQLSIGR